MAAAPRLLRSASRANVNSDGWITTPVSEIATQLGKGFEGIYRFSDNLTVAGAQYVGQSKDVAGRILAHVKDPIKAIDGSGTVQVMRVSGGKLKREIAEFLEIRKLTGGRRAIESPLVTNVRDPLGPKRQAKYLNSSLRGPK